MIIGYFSHPCQYEKEMFKYYKYIKNTWKTREKYEH